MVFDDPTALWVPMAAGSIAARGASRFARWMDSDYIKHPVSNSWKTAMRTQRGSRMPVRRRYRRRRRGIRRRYKRRSTLPTKIVRTLRSVQYFAQNPGAGTVAASAIRINDVNAPFQGISGDQPLYHDQYSALYERAAVIGMSVYAEAVSTETSNPMKVGLTIMTDSTPLAAYEHYLEMNPTSSKVLTSDVDKCTLSLKSGIKRWLGGTKLLTGDNDYSSLIGASPSKIVYCHVWSSAMDQSADPSNVHWIVHVTQRVVYYRPKTYVARS